jgi:hypothetical protein
MRIRVRTRGTALDLETVLGILPTATAGSWPTGQRPGWVQGLRPLLCNCSDQETGKVTQWPTETLVE